MSEAFEGGALLEGPIEPVMYELVTQAMGRQGVAASEPAEHYLVALLRAFVRADAAQLSRALGPELFIAGSLEPAQRRVRLKQVADTSLFLTGIFLDHLEARLATTDYFFEVGSRAYLDLGSLEQRQPRAGQAFSETYTELGSRFADFSSVLASISDHELFASEGRTLGLYRRWLESGHARDERRLLSLGLIPRRDGSGQVH